MVYKSNHIWIIIIKNNANFIWVLVLLFIQQHDNNNHNFHILLFSHLNFPVYIVFSHHTYTHTRAVLLWCKCLAIGNKALSHHEPHNKTTTQPRIQQYTLFIANITCISKSPCYSPSEGMLGEELVKIILFSRNRLLIIDHFHTTQDWWPRA